MDEQLRIAALEYHRLPRPGKISVAPTKGSSTSAISRSPIRRASPTPARRSTPIPRKPQDAHLARQPGRRDHQRHRGARAGQHRPARRQAGDGRQGLPVQEVRRHRRVRHRARTRHDPDKLVDIIARARADVRRHQPRGHQGARVLLHRAQAARADEDPGVPRRPARHRDHRRRGRDSTASRSSARTIGKVKLVCSGAGAAAIACLDLLVRRGPEAREHRSSATARA